MTFKSIEITYDIDAIPGICEAVARPGLPRWNNAERALEFRNDAIELIENALMAACAGEWEEAKIGNGEVNFGFAVDNFDQAEAIVRKVVAGTDFERIREIQRRETDLVALT